MISVEEGAIKSKDIADNELPTLPSADEVLGYKQINFRVTLDEYKELREVAATANMTPTLLAKRSTQAVVKQAGGDVNGRKRIAHPHEGHERASGSSGTGAKGSTKESEKVNWLH